MSLMAYKIIKLETEKEPTFSFWFDREIIDTLDIETPSPLDCPTIIEINRLLVKEALNDHPSSGTEETLKQILKDMGEEPFVRYYCR